MEGGVEVQSAKCLAFTRSHDLSEPITLEPLPVMTLTFSVAYKARSLTHRRVMHLRGDTCESSNSRSRHAFALYSLWDAEGC
jgi:hypothetical protein